MEAKEFELKGIKILFWLFLTERNLIYFIYNRKNLGIKAAEQNDSINSIDNFRKAIELAPEWASSYNNRAQALRLFGRTTGLIF